jgi:hypothetical protein
VVSWLERPQTECQRSRTHGTRHYSRISISGVTIAGPTPVAPALAPRNSAYATRIRWPLWGPTSGSSGASIRDHASRLSRQTRASPSARAAVSGRLERSHRLSPRAGSTPIPGSTVRKIRSTKPTLPSPEEVVQSRRPGFQDRAFNRSATLPRARRRLPIGFGALLGHFVAWSRITGTIADSAARNRARPGPFGQPHAERCCGAGSGGRAPHRRSSEPSRHRSHRK